MPPKQQEEDNTISNSRKSATRILTQNVRGLPEEDDTKLKSIMPQMKTEQWEAACLQETWRLGTDNFHIDNYHIFFQGNLVNMYTKERVMGGVCIILSPTFDLAHKKSGKETFTIPIGEGKNFEGRFISIPLTSPNTEDNRKNIRGETDITLCSVYHPVDNKEYENFNSTLSSLLNHLPQKSNIILGYYINANRGHAQIADKISETQ